MIRFLSAEWLRITKFWLAWVLLGALIIAVALQVNAKIHRLERLEADLAAMSASVEAIALQTGQFEASWLRDNLRYPAIIGYAACLATDSGWFFIILLTAVMGGEDFARRTLRSILTRGIGRAHYLAARCLVLWLAAGVGVLVITLLAAAAGPYVHARVSADPVSLEGLGEALLVPVRAWLTCLPFIIATLFWAVLGRRQGPALGVGIGLHFYEFLNGLAVPSIAIASATGAEFPPIFRWQVSLVSVTLGYNADVLLHWGSPFMKAVAAASPAMKALYATKSIELGIGTLLPTVPWRSVAFLAGYAVLFSVWAVWILRRCDVTYGT